MNLDPTTSELIGFPSPLLMEVEEPTDANNNANSNNNSYGWNLLYGLLYTSSTNNNNNNNNNNNTQNNPQSPTSSISSLSHNPGEFVIDSCKCCTNIIKYPTNIEKFKCVYCQTMFLTPNYDYNTPSHALKYLASNKNVIPMSFDSIKSVADKCFLNFQKDLSNNNNTNPINNFKPLEEYLYRGFSNFYCLSSSFQLSNTKKRLSHLNSNIDFKEIKETYKLLLSLPVKKPFFVLLTAASSLLLNPPNIESPKDLNWLLTFLELPTLPFSVNNSNFNNTNNQKVPKNILFFQSKEVKAVSYKILQRLIGLLSNVDGNCADYLINWFANYDELEFKRKVELINLYINFHLKFLLAKYQTIESDSNVNNSIEEKSLQPSSSQSVQLTSRIWPINNKNNNKKSKLKTNQYSNEWHIKTGSMLLSFFYNAVNSGKCKFSIDSSFFYNSLVDFINVKQDFDLWQTLTGKKSTTKTQIAINDDTMMSVNDYLQSAINVPLINNHDDNKIPLNSKPLFTFCQFPFLISLGSKIAIIEYEAKRQMSKKAEEAFLKAVNKKTIVEVYFKVRVRRNFIANDSLKCIKENCDDLKKSLKIEFIGEPGIDAGGLKKEWFLLLSKDLFNVNNGLFYNESQSNYLWFSLSKDDDLNNNEENLELYFLVGVVLGLAIYNSTILDLKFPLVLYKLLLNKSISFDDFKEIYPETATNLKKLHDMEIIDLYFELTFKDSFEQVHTIELIPNGSEIKITKKNLNLFIKKYYEFYLIEGIRKKFESFKKGFYQVINGNAYSLFSAKEIELVLCGSEEVNSKFNLEILKSITKYNGFLNNKTNPIIDWFWEFFEELSIKDQKKLMLFITGSDRVPATGLISMSFKITRLGKDSNKLPLAHTCFNELCLFEYESKEKLFEKLSIAMHESEGFGLK